MRKTVLALLAGLLTIMNLSAQTSEPTDSLVRLMSAKSVTVIQRDGQVSRKVFGPADFLHNNTTLVCDTAYWWVESQVINAFGNVQIIQEGTTLKSDKLDYYVDRNTAEFRGSLVQLKDREGNTLRTRFLDYNTKDSVAVFAHGGSMVDKDGQIIESVDGTYDSKIKLFTFAGDVNMFSDTVFVRTDSLKYHGNTGLAVFDTEVDIVKNQYHIFGKRGNLSRGDGHFHLFDSVHGISSDQEIWADTLVYDRNMKVLDLFGNVQILDTTRGTTGLGRRLHYEDSLRTMTLSVDAAVIMDVEDSSGKNNPIIAGAQTIKLRAVKKNEVPEDVSKESEQRLSDMNVDPVGELRKKAFEEAKQKAEEAKKARDERMGKRNLEESLPKSVPDEKKKPALEPEAPKDSLSEAVQVVDTSDVYFITAIDSVRIFRTDIQALCDSLEYTSLDSIARLYVNPLIWNDGNRQYSADEVFLVTEGNHLKKANLRENALVVIQEDSTAFDQIHSTEIMAYFDTTSALARFDALGGASAIFYIEENDVLATVNKVDTKMLSATFKDNEIQSVRYYSDPKSDAYPVVQLDSSGKHLTGFKWEPSKRPSSISDMTPLLPRPSTREELASHKGTHFRYTSVFFRDYLERIYDEMDTRSKAHLLSGLDYSMDEVEMSFLDDTLSAKEPSDSLTGRAEIVSSEEEAEEKDTVSKAGKDSVAVHVPTKREIAAQLRAEKRAARLKAREERWEKKDLRDSLKRARKDAEILKKKREATAKKYQRQLKEDAENSKFYERYLKRFEAKYKVKSSSESPELQPQGFQAEQTPSSREN